MATAESTVRVGEPFIYKEEAMLVIKRGVGTTFKIGDDITIMVTDAGNGWAKIGIQAPKSILITRDDAKKGPKQ